MIPSPSRPYPRFWTMVHWVRSTLLYLDLSPARRLGQGAKAGPGIACHDAVVQAQGALLADLDAAVPMARDDAGAQLQLGPWSRRCRLRRR